MDDAEFKEETKKLVKNKIPDVKDSVLDLHHDSAFYWGPQNLKSTSDWISQTIQILEHPELHGNREAFINFFGIIDDTELFSFLREKALLPYELMGIERDQIQEFIAKNQNVEIRNYLTRIWDAFLLVEQLRKEFSDDERFMLRFIRHRFCHVRLSNFSVKIEGMAEEAKFKTNNWERLVELSQTHTVSGLRKLFNEKLSAAKDQLVQIAKLINTEPPDAIFPE